MLGWYATGCENIDGDKFVIDSFFLEREAHGSHVNAMGCPAVAEPFTIHEPLFTLLEQVDRLNGLVSAQDREALDERMVAIGRVKRALEAATGDAAVDRYLARITISHGTGVAINASGTAAEINQQSAAAAPELPSTTTIVITG